MLGSQPMTPIVCQVVPYPTLDEYDEHKVRENFFPIYDIAFPPTTPTKYIIDDAFSCDEDNNQMVGVLIDLYMEIISEHKCKLECIEDVNDESLMEKLPSHWEEYFHHGEKKVQPLLCEEDDYISLCIIKYIDCMRNEDIKDVLTNLLCDESHVIFHTLLE